MNSHTTIRPATATDSRDIAVVHVESWQTTYRGIISTEFLASLSIGDRERMWAESLQHPDFDKKRFTLVAEVDGRIVGFADGGPARNAPGYDCELFAIYLLEPYQKRGLGRLLLNALVERLLEVDFQSAIVGVLADNPSCGFYERLGARYIRSQDVVIAGANLEERFYAWPDLRALPG